LIHSEHREIFREEKNNEYAERCTSVNKDAMYYPEAMLTVLMQKAVHLTLDYDARGDA
jgi:hypothetical protein